MSSNFFFEKWKKTLYMLDELVKLDIEYQESKAHDKKWCDAVKRLSSVLGKYLFIYNEIADCSRHNLQVQKTECLTEIIKAVVTRILELKGQLRKFTSSEYQFIGHGLIYEKLTTYDVEISDVLPKPKKDENINKLVQEAIQRAEDRKRRSISIMMACTDQSEPEEKVSRKLNWWDNDNNSETAQEKDTIGINVTAIYELQKTEELSAEMLEKRKMVTLIQAHERLRKLTVLLIHQKLKRETWEKELKGILRPPAKYELREKSAKMIQRIIRAYFKIKRNRLIECKRDELLDIRLCEKISNKHMDNEAILFNKKYVEKYEAYEAQWCENYNKIKENYIKRNYNNIEDDIHDELLYWFRKWFDEASFFYDIPKEVKGGSVLIVKEEVPSPKEWLEKYEEYLETKKSNKNKTAYELKLKNLEAEKEKLMQKKAELAQKKMDEKILKKLMKNPKSHPGYNYPVSKRIDHLIQAIEDYKTRWSTLDIWEEPGVKEKYVDEIDISSAYMDAKLEIRKSVDVAMRETLKVLKKALKDDYKRNGEQMPEQIKEKTRRRKKQRKHKMEIFENIANKLENLAYRGFLKQYTHVGIEDFIGDPNFAGDDLRCNLQLPEAFAGETRALWMEKCRELSQGSHRVLLVGAKGSGKSTLVHILASINEAVLYEVDPAWIPEELLSAMYLQELALSIAACARATRPSIVYIKHLHRLYYRKAPLGEDVENLNMIKRYLLRKLMKKLRNLKNVTVIASCIDPWQSKSKQILKQFPTVVLLPNTNYSTVNILLNNWILENPVVPRDLNVQSLARALQGYPFGHIKDTLKKFLTADRIIKIAAYGLTAQDINEFFLQSDETKVDYSKYLKWYSEKSHWGMKSKKLLEEHKEFQLMVEKWEQKKKKKELDSNLSDVSTDID